MKPFIGISDKPPINEEKCSIHHALILPYRKSASESYLLYSLSSPIQRLTLIRVDYTKLFDIQDTLFMLLHECAHIIGPRQRDERMTLFVQVVFRMIYTKGLGYYCYDIETGFSDPLNDPREKPSFVICLDEDDQKSTCKYIMDKINTESEEHCKKFIDRINKTKRDGNVIYDRAFIDNDYFMSVLACLDMFIKEELNENEIRRIFKDIWNELYQVSKRYVTKYSESGDPRLRTAIHLQQRYADFPNDAVASQRYIDRFMQVLETFIKDGEIKTMSRVFNDIFADVFAVIVLNVCDFALYLHMIPSFTGMEMESAMLSTENIYRFMAVTKVGFCKDFIDCLGVLRLNEKIVLKIKVTD